MSKKKGLSFEEKRSRLLELFYEKKEVFLLKDLEKIAPKAKSIPSQTVKEVLMSLVGDDLVDTDKIGTSVYFWAFPSKGYTNKLNKLNQLENTLNGLKTKDEELENEIEDYVKNSNESKEVAKRRIEIQDQLALLESEREKLQTEVDRYKDCDPDTAVQLETECKTARDAIDRWTDNIFAVKSWCKKKFSADDSEVNKILNIPSNFDYFES